MQYHVHWGHAMFEFLGVKPGEPNLMPGFEEKSKRFVIQMTEQKLNNMIEELGNRPPFAVLPVGWYQGPALTNLPHKYECYVKAE